MARCAYPEGFLHRWLTRVVRRKCLCAQAKRVGCKRAKGDGDSRNQTGDIYALKHWRIECSWREGRCRIMGRPRGHQIGLYWRALNIIGSEVFPSINKAHCGLLIG